MGDNVNSVFTLTILLILAMAVRTLANRLVPVAMPPGRILGIGAAFIGAIAGNWVGNALLPYGPILLGVNLIAATLGAILFIFLLGLIPFIKILVGRH